MIEITAPSREDIDEIVDKLTTANIGYKLSLDRNITQVEISEGAHVHHGLEAVNAFVNDYMKAVEGWGSCVCEDKEY